MADDQRAILASILAALGQQQIGSGQAEADPAIAAFLKELGQRRRQSLDARAVLGGPGDYDYALAIGAGLPPEPTFLGSDYHWLSREPATGRMLKRLGHPTRHLETNAPRQSRY